MKKKILFGTFAERTACWSGSLVTFMDLRHTITVMVAMLCLCTSPGEAAVNALPASVMANSELHLTQVGSGVYHKLGFTIYNATLWAPDGKWDKEKPYALQLQYKRSLSQKTLVSSAIDNIRAQGITDEATLLRWQKILEETLPAVSKNDEIVGVSVPGKDSQLFFNGRRIASISDRALTDAFFAIWLGDTADPALRTALLEPSGEQTLPYDITHNQE